MSVWPSVSSTHSPALHGSEGELVSISATVQPRDLEDVLEALATLDFPINPQIYHDAAVIYVQPDGTERMEPSTIVEFPAYGDGLPKIRAVLEACGFADSVISVAPMLDEIHGNDRIETAPPSAGFVRRIWRRNAAAVAAGSGQNRHI
jgi:hypothetical protein